MTEDRRPAPADDTDDRATCKACQHYRPGRCGNHRAARMLTPEVGPALANLPQRCPGFKAKA